MSTEDPMIGEESNEAPQRKPRNLYTPPAPKVAEPVPAAKGSKLNDYIPEDPRARAARRAEELREHGSGNDDGEDEYRIDLRIIPDGWSYEWKRHTLLNAEDPSYDVSLRQKGWDPVPASRHPELMPMDYKGNTILRKGMILMERPLEITEEAKDRELRKARAQVHQKEAQLGGPQGPAQFSRDNKGDSMVKIKKSYEPMPIPK